MSERFKVGDRVQAVEGCAAYFPAGAVGTVVLVDDDMYNVKFDAGSGVDPDCEGTWWLSDFNAKAEPVAETKPLHRANDPATSKGGRKVNKYEQAVIDALVNDACVTQVPGLNGKEIALRTGHPLNCITPRFAPLRRKGLIKAAEVPIEWGENRMLPRYIKRDKQIVWVLA